jgi:uncharacterized membrane protein YkoI
MKFVKFNQIITGVATVALLAGSAAPLLAAEEKDETVTLSQTPEKVQKTIKAFASETEIKKIEKGDMDGKMAYEFEIEKAGKKSEVTILPNGKLLGTEEEVALSDIPEAARKTINDQAVGGKIVATAKVVEGGKTVYEAVIEKDGKKAEITVKPNGKLVSAEGEEKEKKEKD